jgi:Tfp pilus assembly protein PilE
MRKESRPRRPEMPDRLEGRDAERGVSIVELMIFMAVFLIILAGVYDAHLSYYRATIRSEARARVQDDARRTIEQFLRELRMAGYGLVIGDDPAPLTPVTAASATSVTYLTTEGGASTNLTADAAVGATTLSVVSSSGFNVTDSIYVADEGHYRTATVTAVGANSLTITPALPAPVPPSTTAGFTPGASVIRQPRPVTYSLGGGTLSRDPGDGTGPQPVIPGVSAVTFSYFDGSNNPVVFPGGDLATVRRVALDITVSATMPGQAAVNFTTRGDARLRNW